jgi:hypothetical protein
MRIIDRPKRENDLMAPTWTAIAWQVLGLLTVATLFFWGQASETEALPDLPVLCENAAKVAAIETGVPFDVLRAITLAESGRNQEKRLRPWPWTVNMEGKGKWFATEQEARAYVKKFYDSGSRSFDIGCFQINYRWHGQAFASIDQMFEPLANARYAAKFLKNLHNETGDWSLAAGAYHSRTPEYSDKYRARFDRLRGSLRPAASPAKPRPATGPTLIARKPTAPRQNGFQLLQSGISNGGLGSLVPISGRDTRQRLISLE